MTFDKEIQGSIEIGVDLFKDLIFASWKAVSGLAKEKYQENDPFGIATRRYIGGLIERYNLVKVLGMREPVPLKSLYVRANILEKISARAGLRPEELAEFFDFDRRAFGKKSETVDGEIIVNRLQKFIVLGKPGAGKTTYLKFLTLMMLDPMSQIEQRRLPVFVTLREWADEQVPLMDFMVAQFDIYKFPDARLFLEKMLAEGKCLVLFDGLDEVSQESNLDDIIRQIQNFTDKYSDNQFVISCRVAAYNHWFERFTDVEMADFNEEQMETFIKNWFHGEPKVATECWERLKSSSPLRELASVPLLLTLLCLEYSESNNFPPNRAELYERAIETLLTKWDSTRRIRRAEVYKQLSLKRKESMFARIAFATFAQNEYFIRERVLAKMIEQYIEHLPGFNAAELEPDSRAVLQAIAAQHGIFVERAKDVYSFAHLTFQEYFTAKYIVDHQWKKVDRDGNLDENGVVVLLEHVVEKYLYEAKWKEVFLLVSGMMDNADELLLLMRKKANEALEVSEINDLFRVAKESLLSDLTLNPDVLRKNNAIFLALVIDHLRTFTNDLNIAFLRVAMLRLGVDFNISLMENFSNHLKSRDVLRASLMIYSSIYSDYINHRIIPPPLDLDNNKLISILNLDSNTLQSFSESTRLTKQAFLEINQYFSANTLILSCLSSGAYVSKPIREKMIHEIFMTKEELEQGGFEQDSKD